jgi:hypothetical protein
MKLNANCTTDTKIIVPDGFTLDGQGRTIRVFDPAGGHFVGGVIENGGAVAHVKNLRIWAPNLANVCDGGNDALGGIVFINAKGSILNNTIVALNQGASGCQEGDAIVAYNDGDTYLRVDIGNNVVQNWQKTGILVIGNVNAIIYGNRVEESRTQANLAANSIQFSFGAIGRIANNEIHGNNWCCEDAAATGILIYEPGSGLLVRNNDVWNNSDVGIYNIGNNVTVERNRVIETSGTDGYYDYGIYSEGTGNIFLNNRIRGYEIPFEEFVPTMTFRSAGRPARDPNPTRR